MKGVRLSGDGTFGIRRRWLNQFVLTLAALAALLALAVGIENYRGKRAWEKCRRELEAKGERLDWQAFVPPLVPDDQNFAMTPLLAPLFDYTRNVEGRLVHRDTNAIARLDKLFVWPGYLGGNWRRIEFADLESLHTFLRELTNEKLRQDPAIAAWLVTPPAASPAEDLLALLHQNDAELAELRAALHRPHARFNIHYEQSLHPLVPHLATLKKFTSVFRFKALAELAIGNTQAALDDTLAMLALSETLQGEPLLISGLVRLAIVQIATQPVWEGLARRQWSAEQIATLQSRFEQSNLVEDMAWTLRGERAFCIQALPRSEPFDMFCWPSGWARQNQAAFARTFQAYVLPPLDPTSRVADVRVSREPPQEFEGLQDKRSSPYTLFGYALLPNAARCAGKIAQAQAVVNLAATACALERYRLARGDYPERLEQLAPEFMKVVPNDPVNGQPLKYRCTDSGRFLLYSVGSDLTDDGGAMREPQSRQPPNLSGIIGEPEGPAPPSRPLDWVWQYPPK